MAFTRKEISDNHWIKTSPGHLYELEKMRSPYEKWVHVICSEENSVKIKALRHLIDEKWEKDEPAIMATMSPASALQLYWVGCLNEILYVVKTLG